MVGARGWKRIGPHPGIAAWAEAARPVAEAAIAASAEPWRCGETWFVGVDALPNAADGSIAGQPFPWADLGLAPEPLHRAQLSVVRPGYPQPWSGESDSAFRFRRDRDAAHLDGLLPVGPQKRRQIAEPHGWILGLPLNLCAAGAAPLTVWEGSHEILRSALRAALAPHDPARWGEVDITEAYQAARRQCFETCPRVLLPARPGEATLLHRLTLHGVAPWAEGAEAPPVGRIVAYFRPQLARVADWISQP